MNKYFLPSINIPLADNITLIITDEWNLRCRYCYEEK